MFRGYITHCHDLEIDQADLLPENGHFLRSPDVA